MPAIGRADRGARKRSVRLRRAPRKGYPQGLKGEQIPLSARIVAVADVYDALISKRPYKDPFPHEIAVDIISSSSNTHFDETVVKAFMKCEKNFSTMKSGLV